ncbi:MAG: dephospho-CoA kinase [Desulfamplus sp.]|nr:dephospho-CoA kinase [Desulfamplus sp.]
MENIEIEPSEIAHAIRGCGKPFHIGLTGGIASGKTTVADMFKLHGPHIVDFDLLAREVVVPGSQGLSRVVGCFGPSILDASGSLDRKVLSSMVFENPEKRKTLESILHPAIFDLFRTRVKEITALEPKAVIVSVIPLLIELSLQPLFDSIVLIHVSGDIQIMRLMERDGIDEKTALKIMASQIPMDSKLQYADHVVDNSGTIEETRHQVDRIWSLLKPC